MKSIPTVGEPAYPAAFANQAFWDEGLSEMSYYDAIDTIYGVPRHYTRVMLLNREWLDPASRVKSERPKPGRDIPVFKLNIAEEIPTENYNDRFMVTLFLNRETLLPEKLAASSQEWCGTTFKQFQWLPGKPMCDLSERPELRVRGFSYFEGEADQEWALPADPVAYPQEALFVLVRAAVAAGRDLDLRLLPSARSTHTQDPIPVAAHLSVGRDDDEVRVPFGRFRARTVTLTCGGAVARFTVESRAPHRLLTYRSPSGLQLSLRYVERRAYWDRSKPSAFYRQGAAP